MGDFDSIRGSVPVPIMRQYLLRKLAEANKALDEAKTTEQLWEARGARRAIKGLQNFPEAIILDLEAEKDEQRGVRGNGDTAKG